MRLLVAAIALVMSTGFAAAKEIVSAEYSDPTRAYPHGALGDDEEWSVLNVKVRRESGSEGGLFQGNLTLTYRIDAPEDMVFEDTAPRLWDITGDGSPEIVVVLSHQNYGAQLAVIGLVDGDLTYIATTPTIGTRFRWLAPVGAADFDGDGNIEIAFVDRPHLAKTLRIWRYTPEGFAALASLKGVTNHRIGDAVIWGGVRDCGEGPEMIVADAGWKSVMAVRLTTTSITGAPIAPLSNPSDLNAALSCPG